VAAFVNRYFEPAWESIRPVPIVRIDFGNGHEITRTLHGNIASYVCDSAGRVFDILPGIYQPGAYLDRLGQFRLLHNYAGQEGADKVAGRLKKYHDDQAKALKANEPPSRFVNMGDMSKARIEGQLKAVLLAGKVAPPTPANAKAAEPARSAQPKLSSAEELANWTALAEDTALNETVRKRQIHGMLAAAGPVPPRDVVRPLYKEVLHADLDDPYLGLGKTLFGNYPFAGEEAR
jgi:hypothetical protein